MPLAPSYPNSSIFPSTGNQDTPSFIENLDESDDEENNDEAFDSEQAPQSSDSSTEVTRFLIKHLPKQLTQLRNEKHELEDKIHDFEQIVSEQRMQMSEHERRVEVERSKTKTLEERLIQVNGASEKLIMKLIFID
jgi:predicted RNase H-like nuclease (RuvC/YqgF family)